MKNKLKYLSLCGMLGYGYSTDSLRYALAEDISFIGVDAGSTDPGPYYLGSGHSFVKDMQVLRDLEPVLKEALNRKIPLIIGTAGGAGAKPHVDHFLELLKTAVTRNNLKVKVAVIYADIDLAIIRNALREDRITPCANVQQLSDEDIDSLTNPVAQMGTEPLMEALRSGADVIVAGRCCDTAIFAANPIMKGYDPGLALHCAKIAECGALCARPTGANDCLICELSENSFTVKAADKARICTPDSVAAHSLYEQPDPHCFYEPEGRIDMTASTFRQEKEGAVTVSGTRLIESAKPTVKLEGARFAGHRSLTIAGISDPQIIQNLSTFEQSVSDTVRKNIKGNIDPQDFQLIFRHYGINGTCFSPAPTPAEIAEVGLVMEVIAPTTEISETVISLVRSTALHQHFPNRKTTAGNLAFPFSPSDLYGGEVYEFGLYHLLEVKDEKLFAVKEMEL